MYILRQELQNKDNDKVFNKILKDNKINQTNLAEKIGIDRGYISQISYGKGISKISAYALCKGISQDLEINDLFIQKIN